MSWPSFSAFLRDGVVQHPSVMCPVTVLWRGYKAYCTTWGFEVGTAEDFMWHLCMTEGVIIRQGGRGRLHRMALGIGLQSNGDIKWISC